MWAIHKLYVDAWYKTADSNSHSDFDVDLPLAINMPDNCICYSDDIVLPVNWTMIEPRKNNLHLGYRIGVVVS